LVMLWNEEILNATLLRFALAVLRMSQLTLTTVVYQPAPTFGNKISN
jgi:hypothetical protein